jgi:hypothetical protein
MKNNQIKNLCISIFDVIILAYLLMTNYSFIGLICAVLTVGVILLIALVYRKDQAIVEKLDLYIFLLFLGILSIHYEQLCDSFTMDLFLYEKSYSSIQIAYMTGTFVTALILLSQKRKSIAAITICKFLGLYFLFDCGSYILTGEYSIDMMGHFLFILTSFGLLYCCNLSRTKLVLKSKRVQHIAFWTSLFYLALKILCTSFKLTNLNTTAFINAEVFPWYVVLGITLLLATVTGIGFHYGKQRVDEDSIFLVTMIGLIWVVKASVYFYFDFYWIAICIYVIVSLGFVHRFIRREATGTSTFLFESIRNIEFYWIVIAAISTVFSSVLIHYGYVSFWISLCIGIPAILFAHHNVLGWAKDALFWLMLLFVIAISISLFSYENAFSIHKVTVSAAFFVFSAIAMWMLNYQNRIGQNRFVRTKISMVVFYSLLMIIIAGKGGASVEVTLEDKDANIGSFIHTPTYIDINILADGKNNEITDIKFAWTSSFMIEDQEIIEVDPTIIEIDPTSFSMQIENRHLTIWAEDKYGVVTRKDCWFYDGASDYKDSENIFRIDTQY